MTREIIRAIDGGLHSLQVTQRDADAILRRIRAEEQRQARPRRLPAPVFAAVLVVLLLGALLTFSLTRSARGGRADSPERGHGDNRVYPRPRA